MQNYQYYKVGDRDIRVYRLGYDKNGNTRYCVSWISLGLSSYASTAKTRAADLRKYSSKRFGGGFTFQCQGDMVEHLEWIVDTLGEESKLNQ